MELPLVSVAIVMAGGKSSRMRETRGPTHKALVPVLGLSMLERNLHALRRFGFLDWWIAISSREPELERFVSDGAAELARRSGATLETIVEDHPLGTIGAVGRVREFEGPLLVVNVDNLTALDLRAFVAHHESHGDALTVAVHRQTWTMPFGEVRVDDGRIVEYLEKPVHVHLISSGTYVLGAAARAEAARGSPLGLPRLIEMLLQSGQRIGAYEHDAPWIDVNDADAVKRAEEMIVRHRDRFEPHEAMR